MQAASNVTREETRDKTGYIGRIPVRNLWLLMLYASDLFRQTNITKDISVEENPDEIADLVANILSKQVEQRIRRNLSFGYQTRAASLNRVRGRIDLLKTERGRLLDKGKIFCRFDELTVDTPRNRYVRSALDKIAALAGKEYLKHKCRSLANNLRYMGVTGEKPKYSVISKDRIGIHNADDRKMIAAAHLAFNLALPTEEAGDRHLSSPDREERWVRRLYEKAVAGFYDFTLSDKGWRITSQKLLQWQTFDNPPDILPVMRADIILNHKEGYIIIDTKFTKILKKNQRDKEKLDSSHIYQIYAYLRSQENENNPLSYSSSGLLLYPSIGETVDQSVEIQGHQIRFATVDLSASAIEIKAQLLNVMR